MIEKLQRKYALSEQGAKDLVKGCLACALQNLSFMFPVGLLYNLVGDLMGGGVSGSGKLFYIGGFLFSLGFLTLAYWVQENTTPFSPYF